MTHRQSKAVILLSGGLDSATTAAMARQRGFELHAIHFQYGQRHEMEARAARKVATSLAAATFVVHRLDLRSFGGSALTDAIDVPKGRSVTDIAAGIPITYVPARNTIFLALALAHAEVIGSSDIFIGINSVDYSGYPDCRPEFVAAFQQVARLGTRAGAEGAAPQIHTPLIAMTKGQIIREGLRLGVDFGLTHSCYDPAPSGLACGYCDSCLLRRKGFDDVGLIDPIGYAQTE